MPNFANPFQGNVDRKLTNAELMQALRLDIAGELEAIFLYDAHYLATDDPVAITLMRHLDPREAELFLDGESEVREQLEELGIIGESIPAPAAGPTVGSLVEE